MWSPKHGRLGGWSRRDQVSRLGWSARDQPRPDPGAPRTTPTVATNHNAVRWTIYDQDSPTVGRLATSSGNVLVATRPPSGAGRRGWSPQGQVAGKTGLPRANFKQKLVPARPPFSPDARDWLRYDQLAPEAGPIPTSLAVILVAPRPTSSSPRPAVRWGGRGATRFRTQLAPSRPRELSFWSSTNHPCMAMCESGSCVTNAKREVVGYRPHSCASWSLRDHFLRLAPEGGPSMAKSPANPVTRGAALRQTWSPADHWA